MPCNCKCCCGCCCDGSTGSQSLPAQCESPKEFKGKGTQCDVCCDLGEIREDITSEEDCTGTWIPNGRCLGNPCSPCSGPCDEENPCPEGCYCCDGVCQSEPCDCSGPCDEENPCAEGCECCNGTCFEPGSTNSFCRVFYGNPYSTVPPVGTEYGDWILNWTNPDDYECPDGYSKTTNGAHYECTNCIPCPTGFQRSNAPANPLIWSGDCGGDCYADYPASGPCNNMFNPSNCGSPPPEIAPYAGSPYCLCEPNPLP